MYKYILKRLILLLPVLIGVSLVVFVMLEIPPGSLPAPMRQKKPSNSLESRWD